MSRLSWGWSAVFLESLGWQDDGHYGDQGHEGHIKGPVILADHTGRPYVTANADRLERLRDAVRDDGPRLRVVPLPDRRTADVSLKLDGGRVAAFSYDAAASRASTSSPLWP